MRYATIIAMRNKYLRNVIILIVLIPIQTVREVLGVEDIKQKVWNNKNAFQLAVEDK